VHEIGRSEEGFNDQPGRWVRGGGVVGSVLYSDSVQLGGKKSLQKKEVEFIRAQSKKGVNVGKKKTSNKGVVGRGE